MKKVIFCLIWFLLLVSCSEESEFPSEFDFLIGKWKAYKYRQIFDFGGGNSSHIDYSTDSIGVEYFCDIGKNKIEIINGQTNSATYIIKSVEVLVKDSALITFHLLTYSYPNTSLRSQYITYTFTDEINYSSAHERPSDNPNSVVDVYYLKHIGD